jgi:hypothetical protein
MKAIKLVVILFVAVFVLISCSLDSLTGKRETQVTRVRVEGVVSDAQSGQAVKDALVEINLEKSKTDKKGKFVMPRVNLIPPVIAPPLKVTAEGYYPHYSILEISKKEFHYKYKECELQLIPHSAPAHLRASYGDTRIKLQWNPPAVGNPLGYNVYLIGSSIPVNAEPIKELSYIDLGLTNGVEHIYFVRAVLEEKENGSVIESPVSNRVHVIPKAAKHIGEKEQKPNKKSS